MNYTEEATLFDCEGNHLLGILARPEKPARTGIIVVVGGPQYRVGSHRQFVLLSRVLAAAGFAVLRFDYRSMGDSDGGQRDFQSVSADIAAAVNTLQKHLPTVDKVALWGLCDGASAALLYWHETHDARVSGLCLLNPWVRSEASLARTQVKHYYTQRLRQKEFWLKLLRGQVAWGAWRGFAQKIRLSAAAGQRMPTVKQTFQQRMAFAWHAFPGPILLLLSGDDYTAKEFLEHAGTDAAWHTYLAHAHLQRLDVPGVDHTFSSAGARKLAEQATLAWLLQQGEVHPATALNLCES